MSRIPISKSKIKDDVTGFKIVCTDKKYCLNVYTYRVCYMKKTHIVWVKSECQN